MAYLYPPVPENIVYIRNIDDFPEAIAGVITLAPNTRYIGNGQIFPISITDTLVLSAFSVIEHLNLTTSKEIVLTNESKIVDSQITYTGSNTLFTCAEVVGNVIRFLRCNLILATGTLFDIDSTAGGIVIFEFVSVIGAASLGMIKHVRFLLSYALFLDFGDGFTLEDLDQTSIHVAEFTAGRNNSINCFTFQGTTQGNIEIGSSLFNIQSNEYAFKFNTGTTFDGIKVRGGYVAISDNAFAASSYTNESVGVKFANVTNVSDSKSVGNIYFYGNVAETDIPATLVPIKINGTYLEGNLERFSNGNGQLTYLDNEDVDIKVSATSSMEPASGITIQLASYTGITKSGLETVTYTNATNTVNKVGHTLSDGDSIRLSTDGTLPTGLRDDLFYYVINSAADTFQLSLTSGGAAETFTDDGTGTQYYSLGWILEESASVITADSGNPSSAHTIALVHIEQGDKIEIFAENRQTTANIIANSIQCILN